MRRFVLIVLTSAILAASPVLAAEEKDDICAALDNASENSKRRYKELYKDRPRDKFCAAVYWSEFQATPATELFESATYTAYRQALQREDCDAAMSLLTAAFVKAYPRAPDIDKGRGRPELAQADFRKPGFDIEKWRSGMEELRSLWLHYLRWKSSVLPKAYPELTFCEAMQGFHAAQSKISELGLDPPRFQHLHDVARQHPEPVKQRNWAIFSLFYLSHHHRYVPAFLALLDLSRDGKALRFIPEYQYYLLKYLIAHEGVPADEVTNMLAAAAAKLPEGKRAELDRQASQGEYTERLPVND